MASKAQILAKSAIRNTLYDIRCALYSVRHTKYAIRCTLYAIRNMQNKANFQKSQMNVNPYNTTDYENKSNWTLGENKPNSNPNKAN